MSADPPQAHARPENPLPDRSAWLTFFDTFLQEKNIKWMLGLGGLILLASSLMLVTSHWQAYTPLWKSLVVMGYTAVIYVLGEITYRQLALRRTGTSLFAMTVLLIPISFLAVRAVHGDVSAAGHIAGIGSVLLANTLFAAYAGRRILGHFLRQDQPTFLASYLGLALAGAIVPGLPGTYAVPAAILLWAMFAIGSIKVNRHVFWLGEEHQSPRVFGFFPILLLGMQFLSLFAFLAPGMELPWIGLGLVLTAIPVLLTADSLAKVFEERTGNLVRPLPWSLVTPLLVGIGLCAAGVCLSFTEFRTSIAPVPTALLASMIFVQVARRTQHTGFVWAMWGSLVLAYQASPVFFREFARAFVRQGAEAVSEARLPIAFYGLTYLPLLIVATIVAVFAAKRANELFARPTKSFAIGMTTLLWAVSFTHVKALFPVGLAILVMFTLQMIAFREPRLRFGLIGAYVTMSFGLTPFLEQVLFWSVTPETSLWVMSLSAGLLLLPDRFLPRGKHLGYGHVETSHPYAIGDVASLVLTLAIAAAWAGRWSELSALAVPWLSGLFVSGLLLIHAYRWCQFPLSDLALIFSAAAGVMIADAFGVAGSVIVPSAILLAVGLWCLSIGMRQFPAARVTRAFAEAAERVAGCVLTLGILTFSLPRFLLAMAGAEPATWWMSLSTLVPVVWTFDAARRWQTSAWTYAGSASVLALAGAVSAVSLGHEEARVWLPLVWSGVGLIGVAFAPRPFQWSFRNSSSNEELALSPTVRFITEPIGRFATVLFVVLAVGTLPFFTVPSRVASLVSVLGLFALAGDWRNAWLRHLALGLLNWHLLSGVIQLVVPGAEHLFDLSASDLIQLSLPLAVTAAVSRLAWNLSSRPPGTPMGEWISFQRLMLLGVTCFGLIWSLKLLPAGLPVLDVIFAVSVFVLLAIDQLWQAVRKQDEAHVWTAEGVVLAGIGYLLLFDVIQFGSGLSMYAVLLSGWTAWVVGHFASNHQKWQVLSRPMFLTGYALPAVTVGVAIVRHFTVPSSLWLGMNSLALLLAGGFYFWRAIEEKRKTWMLAAAAILNVALALLWRELRWHDPQLFAIPLGISILALVEWLKSEIPAKAHDPLRYLGALVILVSPVFHIVGGSWVHLLTLMIASVAVTLTAMGLRIRALMYTGTGFLVGDLLAMVVRGSIDNPTLLWIAGILFGLAVIALAAYCEKNREEVLQRLRMMAAKLETWE